MIEVRSPVPPASEMASAVRPVLTMTSRTAMRPPSPARRTRRWPTMPRRAAGSDSRTRRCWNGGAQAGEPGAARADQARAADAARGGGKRQPHLALLERREQVDTAVDGLGGVGGV